MSIHILTQDPTVRKHLLTLMEELDQECTVHAEVEPLLKALKKLGKADAVFYDLTLEDVLWAFERLYIGCKRTNLIGFEPLSEETANGGQHCPDGMEHYLLLPPNANRAKARLQEVLKSIAQKAVKKKPARKKAKRTSAAKKVESKIPFPVSSSATPVTAPVELTIARYLQAQSVVMQALLTEINTAAGSDDIVLFDGEDGAEFELAARELNYHANGDIQPLYVFDPTHITTEELDKLHRQAKAADKVHYCYFGDTCELTPHSAEELVSHLKRSDASHLRLIFGHTKGSEDYTPKNVVPFIEKLWKVSRRLSLPSISERAADIPLIVQRIFSTLRTAHPFLMTRTVSHDAITHLQEHRDELDYARITRIIRNAMALNTRDILTKNEVKNYNDNTPTTQHLIESLADEQFFSVEEGGVA